ncbi:partial 3-isopropylmalate/(R)-2-methylmalate dehydratase small subunit, partial [Anaerolineae bacterium]
LLIIARSVARIFMQNAVNLGLNLVVAPGFEAAQGDEVEVRGEEVVNVTTGKKFPIEKLPRARQAIVDAGGLIAYTRKRMAEQASAPAGRG